MTFPPAPKNSNHKNEEEIKPKIITNHQNQNHQQTADVLNSKTRGAISDLKKTTSLHIDSIKRRSIDFCYSDLLEDMDASHIRLQKRFKVSESFKKPMTSSSPSLNNKTRVKMISDLKKTTSLHIDSIKRSIDCCYSDLLKDMDASHNRLQKRFKAQYQACEQSMVEAEKDFKKMSDHISETHDTMEASYTDVIAEAQAQATRLCKTTIPELKQSVEKAIDTLRTHYGTAST